MAVPLGTKASLRVADGEERLILATGKYLGEGFDDARLDTLFITMPIAWKGTLAQYVGRLHREHGEKRDVVVYDYVDAEVPVLNKMAAKRRVGYRALGYQIDSVTAAPESHDEKKAASDGTGDDHARPSEVSDRYWIYAERSRTRRMPTPLPESTPGKAVVGSASATNSASMLLSLAGTTEQAR
jgi:superfamily II DNA or RNA helicase